ALGRDARAGQRDDAFAAHQLDETLHVAMCSTYGPPRLRSWLGAAPDHRRIARVNWLGSANPRRAEISAIERRSSRSSASAASWRTRSSSARTLVWAAWSWRWRVRRDTWRSVAIRSTLTGWPR